MLRNLTFFNGKYSHFLRRKSRLLLRMSRLFSIFVGKKRVDKTLIHRVLTFHVEHKTPT